MNDKSIVDSRYFRLSER